MRIKSRDDWHNFSFKHEKKLGNLEVAISLNAEVLKTFVQMANERISRNTGLRFKFVAKGAQEIVTKKEGDSLSYQLYSEKPYIFPNVSAHTDRYDSPYNRVEFYIPLERIFTKEEIERINDTGEIQQLSLFVIVEEQ